jgi:hypothetical protein
MSPSFKSHRLIASNGSSRIASFRIVSFRFPFKLELSCSVFLALGKASHESKKRKQHPFFLGQKIERKEEKPEKLIKGPFF